MGRQQQFGLLAAERDQRDLRAGDIGLRQHQFDRALGLGQSRRRCRFRWHQPRRSSPARRVRRTGGCAGLPCASGSENRGWHPVPCGAPAATARRRAGCRSAPAWPRRAASPDARPAACRAARPCVSARCRCCPTAGAPCPAPVARADRPGSLPWPPRPGFRTGQAPAAAGRNPRYCRARHRGGGGGGSCCSSGGGSSASCGGRRVARGASTSRTAPARSASPMLSRPASAASPRAASPAKDQRPQAVHAQHRSRGGERCHRVINPAARHRPADPLAVPVPPPASAAKRTGRR